MTATLMDEAVEAALESCGWAWTRRDGGWAVPANAWLPREIQIHLGEGGVVVTSVLVEAEEDMTALKQFLARAEAGFRGIRCEVEKTTARLWSRVEVEDLDAALTRSVRAVGAAVRTLHREAAALLNAEAAGAYRAFHSGKS
jgi:hypothetical protein